MLVMPCWIKSSGAGKLIFSKAIFINAPVLSQYMAFSDNEKEFLRCMVKQALEQVHSESEVVIHHPDPEFLAGETRYEDFLKNLLKKLE